MPNTTTVFDTKKHHIYIPFYLVDAWGEKEELVGVLDTGAPKTEFSDFFLVRLGFSKIEGQNVQIKPGLQTQKYGKIILPSLEICGHTMQNYEVMVSRFDKSWGIAALIGLDFFRRFRVTVDYKEGHLVTAPL